LVYFGVYPDEIYGFLIDIAYYVITTNVTLKHGETIGFTEEQKLKIIRSKGIAVEKGSIVYKNIGGVNFENR